MKRSFLLIIIVIIFTGCYSKTEVDCKEGTIKIEGRNFYGVDVGSGLTYTAFCSEYVKTHGR